MRPTVYLTGFAFFLLTQTGLSQSTKSVTAYASEPKGTLAQIVARMEKGVYERVLNLGYIPSPANYNRTDTVDAHVEFTLLFFRFYGFERVDNEEAYIGKVFMSERYLEKHYNRVYTSRAAYETDKDGKFMACKIYFDERSLEYRVNIYPDHLLNICQHNCAPVKGMHFNRDACTTTEQHWQSLRYVLSMADKHFDDFSKPDHSGAINLFLNPANQLVNIDRNYLTDSECSADVDLFKPKGKAKRNTLLRINLHKQIKLFRLGSIDDSLQNVGKTLTLKFTKYALSEDLIEGPEYTCAFINLDSLHDDRLAARGQYGEFVSRNPLYRSLIVSNEPNDLFISGLDLTPRLQFSYLGDSSLPLSTKKQVPARSETKRQDYLISTQQAQSPEILTTPKFGLTGNVLLPLPEPGEDDPAVLTGQIRITTRKRLTAFWVYWGHDRTVFGENSRVTLSSRVYLRDAPPRPIAGSSVWFKGQIAFFNDKPTPPRDAGTWHYSGDYWPDPQHRWLHVYYRPSTPITAKK